jgi:hypothetical protein
LYVACPPVSYHRQNVLLKPVFGYLPMAFRVVWSAKRQPFAHKLFERHRLWFQPSACFHFAPPLFGKFPCL